MNHRIDSTGPIDPDDDQNENLTWAIAIVVGLALGIPLYQGKVGPARAAARGDSPDDQVLRRDTWCPTPDQRAAMLREPYLIAPPDSDSGSVAEPEPGLCVVDALEADIKRRIIGRLERINAKLAAAPELAKCELTLLIAELREGRAEQP